MIKLSVVSDERDNQYKVLLEDTGRPKPKDSTRKKDNGNIKIVDGKYVRITSTNSSMRLNDNVDTLLDYYEQVIDGRVRNINIETCELEPWIRHHFIDYLLTNPFIEHAFINGEGIR